MLRSIFKFLVSIFAIMLIVIGVVVTPTPAPFGIIFIALGFFLLTAAAPDLVRWLRRRWPWLDRQVKKLEKRLPDWLARHLRRTDAQDEEKERPAAA